MSTKGFDGATGLNPLGVTRAGIVALRNIRRRGGAYRYMGITIYWLIGDVPNDDGPWGRDDVVAPNTMISLVDRGLVEFTLYDTRGFAVEAKATALGAAYDCDNARRRR